VFAGKETSAQDANNFHEQIEQLREKTNEGSNEMKMAEEEKRSGQSYRPDPQTENFCSSATIHT